MKELTIKIKYDDTDGYTGHGDVPNIIKHILEQEIEFTLEDENVIKKGSIVEIISNK